MTNEETTKEAQDINKEILHTQKPYITKKETLNEYK